MLSRTIHFAVDTPSALDLSAADALVRAHGEDLARDPGAALIPRLRRRVARRGGAPIAHAASLPQRVRIDGEERSFGRLLGLAALPRELRARPRPGPFVETVRALVEETAGSAGDLVVHGFLAPVPWRVLQRTLGFELVRRQGLLRRRPGPGPCRAPDAVGPLHTFDEQSLWLYDRACGSWAASLVRDAATLMELVGRGARDTAVLGVRDGEGILRGQVILRLRASTGRRELWVADWLVPEGEPDTAEVLLEAVLASARRVRADEVVALVPEWSPAHLRFQEKGFRQHPSDLLLAARCFQHRRDAFWLRDGWWYQPLDAGLV